MTELIPKERPSKALIEEGRRPSAVSLPIRGGSMTCMVTYGNGVLPLPVPMVNHVCYAAAAGTMRQGNVVLRFVERVPRRDITVMMASGSLVL